MKIRRLFSLFASISMAGMVCLLVILAITVVLESQSLAGQQHYNAHLAQYKMQEEVKTRHILIAVKPGANAATDAAAKAKAQDVLNQLKAGASFAVLAMKYSDDLGSKDQGGELPMFPTSQLVPAYANAAMALKPGETSGLVRSPFGYHIIQLEKKQAAGARLTLAQVETLITHGVPDSTLSSQIRVHGLTFTPTTAILDSLHAKGAGPLTLEVIQEAALYSDVSKPGVSCAR